MTTVTIVEHKPSFWRKTKAKAKYYGVATVGAFSALTASTAHAALDVAPLTQEINGNSQSVQTIMLAVLTIAALFVGFVFIKRALR